MKTAIIYLFALITVFFAGCGNNASEDVHEDDRATTEEMESNEEVHLNDAQMDVMGIELGKPILMNLSNTVKANGRLELPPQNKASLSTMIGGQITRIMVLEGAKVTKGQILAELENTAFISMQEDYLKAKAQAGLKESEYLRKKKLLADSLSSEKEFQQAEADYISANANLNALRAKLTLLHTNLEQLDKGIFQLVISIKAPIKGYVKHISANIGKYVNPGEELFEIVDNDHIHIDLMVYEKDIEKVALGQRIVFALSNQSGHAFEGVVFALGKAINEETKAMVVHAEIDNKQGNLLPGMYVDARIITSNQQVVSVPAEAIIQEGGLSYVFVLKEDDDHGHSHGEKESHTDEFVFQRVEVNTGVSDIGFTEVVPVEAMNLKTSIVSKGAFYLQAELIKGEGGHGHHH